MKENYLRQCSLDMKLCRPTWEYTRLTQEGKKQSKRNQTESVKYTKKIGPMLDQA